MGLFNKILHAGEGRKLKLAGVDRRRSSPRSSPRCEAAPTTSSARSPHVARAARPRRRRRHAAGAPRRPPARGVRRRARGGQAHARPAPLRRADHGRRRAALRLGRRDEDRRGQDPRRHAARATSTRSPAAASTSSPSTTTSPSATPSGWARSTASSGSRSAWSSPTIDDPDAKRRAYAADITYGTNNEFGFDYLRDNMAVLARRAGRSAATTSRSSTRSTRSSSTRPARRSSSRAAPTTRRSSTSSSPAIVKDLQRDRDYEVDEAKRTVVPTEEGIDRVEEALGVENLYEHVNQNFVHQLQAGAARQGAVQARRRLRRRRTAR